jgi:hypothetical protein
MTRAEAKELDRVVRTANLNGRRLRAAGVGARVRTTLKAIGNGVVKRPVGGTIVGFGSHLWDVRVRKDGNKTASQFHVDFWKPLPGQRA